MQAVVLLHTRQVEGPDGVAPLLAEGLSLAGLPPATASAAWLDFEVSRLREGARKAAAAGDAITAFFYRQIVMCLLAHASSCWEAPPPPGADGSSTPQRESSGSGGCAIAEAASGVLADACTPGKCLSDGGSLPPGEEASPQWGSSRDTDASPQQPESHAFRFRQLMGAWQAGRGSSGSSPQQPPPPQPPASIVAEFVSPLSGALHAVAACCCACAYLQSC